MDNEWKHSLNDRMKDYEEPAPEGLWEGISKSPEFVRMVSGGTVPAEKTVVPKNSRRLWFPVAGGMAAVFALFLLLWRQGAVSDIAPGDSIAVVTPPMDKPETVIPNPSIPDMNVIPGTASKETNGPVDFYRLQVEESAAIGKSGTVPEIPDQVGDDVDEPVVTTLPEEPSAHQTEMPSHKSDESSRHQSEGHSSGQLDESSSSHSEEPSSRHQEESTTRHPALDAGSAADYTTEVPSEPRRRWSTGLLASNIPTSSSSSQAGENLVPAAVQSGAAGVSANPFTDIRTFNTTRETNTSYKHYQPIKVGVSVRYNISRSWSVETGLTYSYLYSNIRSGSEDYYYNGARTLHYIGIPLNFNFNIWGNRDLTFYASAGGMMEKCVGGKLRTTAYFNGAKGDTSYENVMVKPLQWSVSASVGLQYNISGLIGIYIEPGATYYFNNGSPVETFYSDRPLNFNLELGLRFSF